MRLRTRRTLAATFVLTLVVATSAFAGPLGGKTYVGQTASTGTNSAGRHLRLHPSASPVSLSVAHNGKTVTIHLSSHYALFYCVTTEALYGQSTKPAKISSNGSFRATVGERFTAGAGPPPVTEIVSGKFSGRRVSGTILTEAPPCGGTTTFSASAG